MQISYLRSVNIVYSLISFPESHPAGSYSEVLVAIVLPVKNVFSCKYLPPLYPSSLSGRKERGMVLFGCGPTWITCASIGHHFSVYDNE